MSGRERSSTGLIRVGGSTPHDSLAAPFYEQTHGIRVVSGTPHDSLAAPFYEQTRCIRVRAGWFDDFDRSYSPGWGDPDYFPHTGTLDQYEDGSNAIITGQWGGTYNGSFSDPDVWNDPAASVSAGVAYFDNPTATAAGYDPGMGIVFKNPFTFPLEVKWTGMSATRAPYTGPWWAGYTWFHGVIQAHDASQTTLTLDAGYYWRTGIPHTSFVLTLNVYEDVLVTGGWETGTLTVTRGYNGTTPTAQTGTNDSWYVYEPVPAVPTFYWGPHYDLNLYIGTTWGVEGNYYSTPSVLIWLYEDSGVLRVLAGGPWFDTSVDDAATGVSVWDDSPIDVRAVIDETGLHVRVWASADTEPTSWTYEAGYASGMSMATLAALVFDPPTEWNLRALSWNNTTVAAIGNGLPHPPTRPEGATYICPGTTSFQRVDILQGYAG